MWPRPLRHWLNDRKIKAVKRRYARKLIVLSELKADSEKEKAAAIKAKIAYAKALEKYAE